MSTLQLYTALQIQQDRDVAGWPCRATWVAYPFVIDIRDEGQSVRGLCRRAQHGARWRVPVLEAGTRVRPALPSTSPGQAVRQAVCLLPATGPAWPSPFNAFCARLSCSTQTRGHASSFLRAINLYCVGRSRHKGQWSRLIRPARTRVGSIGADETMHDPSRGILLRRLCAWGSQNSTNPEYEG